MNSLFHTVLHNKLLFNRVIYFVHQGYCSKYHCRLTCIEVEYVNWLVRLKRFDVVQKRLETFDPPFLSPLSNDSLCILADDISTHQLLLQLLKSNHPILKNTIITSTVLSKIIEQQSKYNQNNNNSNIEKELIDIILHKSISIVLDPGIYMVATTYGRLDVITTLLSHYLIAKRDGIFVINDQKFILGSQVVQLAIQHGHLPLLEFYNKVEEEYGVVVYFNQVMVDLAATNGRFECLNWLLLNRPDLSFTPNAFSKSALNGHLESIKILHQYNLNNNNNGGNCTVAALVEAARANRLDIIQYLINNQLVMDIVPEVKEDILDNAFASTSNQDSIELIVYIMERVQGNIDVSYCAIAAAKSGYVKAIQYLMDKKNAKLLNNQVIDKNTSLHMVLAAVTNKQYKVLDYMRTDPNGGIKLGKMGFDLAKMIQRIDYKDTKMMDYLFDHFDQKEIKKTFKKYYHSTTLYLGNPRVFTLLFGKPNVHGIKNYNYLSFIQLLVRSSIEILQLFEKYQPKSTYIKYQDLIDQAARYGNHEMVKYIHQTQKLELSYDGVEWAIESMQEDTLIYMVKYMQRVIIPLDTLLRVYKVNSYKLVHAIKERFGKNDFEASIPPNTYLFNWLDRIDILDMFDQYMDNDNMFIQPGNDEPTSFHQFNESPDIVGHFFHLHPWIGNCKNEGILKKMKAWSSPRLSYWNVILYILDLNISSPHTYELESDVVEQLLITCISTDNIQIFDALISRVTITDQLYNELLTIANQNGYLLQYLKLTPFFSSFNK